MIPMGWMITPAQARELKRAGLDAYNHNLDTSRDHYPNITTACTYEDRLATFVPREAGLTLCGGGILGLGESVAVRCNMLSEIAALDPHPESVPVNLLVPLPGIRCSSSAIFAVSRSSSSSNLRSKNWK
jgi:biotin synthase